MKKHPFTFKPVYFMALIMSMALLAYSIQSQAQVNTGKRTITEKRFERKMQKKSAVLLDVRTPEEFQSGHLPGAVNIDVQKDDFEQNIQPLDKNKTYLIYCKSGRRSEKALKMLYDAGFKKAYHLKGGIIAWQGAVEK
jgi:rhodanese-related sulfurtransferase